MKPAPNPELWELLAELSRKYPHWRFGQLVANIADWADQPVWDVEDQQFIDAIRLHLAHVAASDHAVRS